MPTAAQHHKLSKLAEQNNGAKSVVARLLGLFRRKRGRGRPAHNQQQKALADARRAEIVACAVAAVSLTEAGKQYDLSRERVRQLCAMAGVSIRPIRSAMVAERKAKEQPPRLNAAERFLSYVEKTDTCWLWTGAVNHHNQGWGIFSIEWDGGRRTLPAHRASWILFRGEIPPERLPSGSRVWRVSQTCNNVLCVNPDHLALRTQQEVVNKREHLRAAGAYPPRFNARKTHCKRGHEFTEENTYRYKGGRSCRACSSVRSQAYQAKQSQPEAVHV